MNDEILCCTYLMLSDNDSNSFSRSLEIGIDKQQNKVYNSIRKEQSKHFGRRTKNENNRTVFTR